MVAEIAILTVVKANACFQPARSQRNLHLPETEPTRRIFLGWGRFARLGLGAPQFRLHLMKPGNGILNIYFSALLSNPDLSADSSKRESCPIAFSFKACS